MGSDMKAEHKEFLTLRDRARAYKRAVRKAAGFWKSRSHRAEIDELLHRLDKLDEEILHRNKNKFHLDVARAMDEPSQWAPRHLVGPFYEHANREWSHIVNTFVRVKETMEKLKRNISPDFIRTQYNPLIEVIAEELKFMHNILDKFGDNCVEGNHIPLANYGGKLKPAPKANDYKLAA